VVAFALLLPLYFAAAPVVGCGAEGFRVEGACLVFALVVAAEAFLLLDGAGAFVLWRRILPPSSSSSSSRWVVSKAVVLSSSSSDEMSYSVRLALGCGL